ncbi:hypothetical protein ACKFKG_22865 [Phormidesmis sp. 146-35]
MPQDVTSQKSLLDAQSWEQTEALPEPFQVDSFADRLMDDLFDDVERLLEGAVPPATPVSVEAPVKRKLDIAPPPLSSGLLSAPSFPQWKPKIDTDDLTLPELGELTKTKPPEPRRSTFDRLLIVTCSTSAIAALAIWSIQQGIPGRVLSALTSAPAPTTVAQAPQPVDTNAQFSAYVQRSLEAIDRKATTGKSEGLPTAPYNGGMPTVPVPKNQPPARSSTTLPRAPITINMPAAPAASVPDNSRNRELNQILTRLASVLERLSPTANRPVSVQPAAPIVPQSEATGPQRTMVGVLEGADPSKSVVLFEMNGVTQRYYIGESIGSSGWSLVEVSKQYATVRRNGQVRTLSTGQKL